MFSSTHDYVYPHTRKQYFSDPRFPENLFDVWDSQYVWLERTTGRAAMMGEYGGSLEDNDRAVQQHLVKVHVRC